MSMSFFHGGGQKSSRDKSIRTALREAVAAHLALATASLFLGTSETCSARSYLTSYLVAVAVHFALAIAICRRVHLALTACSFSARPGWEGLKGGTLSREATDLKVN